MNDSERSDWVDNDEGLYNLWKESKMSKRRWIKKNRHLIDDVAGDVVSGAKPAHYLAYPRGESHGQW